MFITTKMYKKRRTNEYFRVAAHITLKEKYKCAIWAKVWFKYVVEY